MTNSRKAAAESYWGNSRQASALYPGDSVEKNGVRIKMWADQLEVTDLTNAGKRGKKVDTFGAIIPGRDLSPLWNLQDLIEGKSYRSALQITEGYLEENPQLRLYKQQQRGVDVTPAGFRPIAVRGDHAYVECDYKGFRVRDLDDLHNDPTCIPASNGKSGIPVFYRWLSDNEAAVERMTYREVLKEMDKLGLKYNTYCAMD